jgi:hypothetical protein
LSRNVDDKLLGLLDPWKMLFRRLCNQIPTPPSSPEEPITILTQRQSFGIAVLLALVDWTSNITCAARRRVFTVCLQITVTLIASVHYLLPVYREVSRFEDGVHVIFTFNKNICVANISHLSKVCDDTIPNLITMKQVELLTLQSYRGFVAIFSPTISGQSMWDAWCGPVFSPCTSVFFLTALSMKRSALESNYLPLTLYKKAGGQQD